MSDFGRLQPGIAEGAVQSLLEARRWMRNTESMIEGMMPLIENEETSKELEEIREIVAKVGYRLQKIYNRNAKETFKA